MQKQVSSVGILAIVLVSLLYKICVYMWHCNNRKLSVECRYFRVECRYYSGVHPQVHPISGGEDGSDG